MSRWHVHKGKSTLSALMKRIIKEYGGPMPLNDLLKQLQDMGYMPGPIKKALLDGAMDLNVDRNGMVRPTGG